MPKSRKKKNADFQKVKLKVGRRVPKGQNETATNFSSRTIRITQQIKNATQASEPRTKRKQVLKDLLPKCDHHNPHVRLTGVEGISELVIADPYAVLMEMADIFRRLLPLLSDRDPLVRQAVLKLFKIIFANGDTRKIAGFFPLLSTHLCCAMTHICDDVQQDSLQFFDQLLDKFPMDVTGNMSQLLIQIFIEQISTQVAAGRGTNKGRTLLVNPNSKQSSPKARAKILERLGKLVDAFLEKDKTDNVPQAIVAPTVHVSDYPRVRGPLVSPSVKRMWRSPYLSLDMSSDPNFKENEYSAMLTDAGKLQKFVELLLPLLKQCWAEVCPSSPGTDLLDQTGQKLTEKSLPLVTSVVGILHALVECWICLCKHQENRNTVPQDAWFQSTLMKELKQLLMLQFPVGITEHVQHKTEGQTQSTRLSALQVSVLKLNLTIIDIMASFPSAGRDGSGQMSNSKSWQTDIISYMLDHITHCTGSDLGRTVTAVLRKMFFNFNPSKKLDKLLKKVHLQYSKAHPLSVEKRVYLAMFEALAFDDCSPYKDRLELLGKFFHSLPDLLLQLPKEGVQTAQEIVKIMQRGGQQNCPPFLAILRQNVERLFDIEKGVLAVADPSVHAAVSHAVYWMFRMDPPSAPQLKLFAQNCRLPQVSLDVAKTLINALDITYWHLNYDKAVFLKERQPCFMTFLTGMISGHTKEEIEALQLSSQPRIPSLIGIVWNCDAEQLDRHAAIFEWCKVRFRGYLKPTVMLGVMQGVWTSKVINVHRWHSIHMAYGILHHWVDMTTLALPSDNSIHVDCRSSLETQQASQSKELGGAVESVKLHLQDFARLCLSLAFDIVSVEMADGNEGSPDAQVVRRMWQTVVQVCGVSLRMLIKMCQLMAQIVQEGSERDALIIFRLVTRLLQTEELMTVWGRDQGQAVAQLEELKNTVLVGEKGMHPLFVQMERIRIQIGINQ